MALVPPALACELHPRRRHYNRTIERHHIMPQAWQQLVQGRIFDVRTAQLAPTCHRNVHDWLVQIMHAVAQAAVAHPELAGDDVRLLAAAQDVFTAAAAKRDPQWEMALEAPYRWNTAGYQLGTLVAAEQWGEA